GSLESGHSIPIGEPAVGPPRSGFVLRLCIRKADEAWGEATLGHGLADTRFSRPRTLGALAALILSARRCCRTDARKRMLTQHLPAQESIPGVNPEPVYDAGLAREGAVEGLSDAIGECTGFEHWPVPRGLDWLVSEDGHDHLIAAPRVARSMTRSP